MGGLGGPAPQAKAPQAKILKIQQDLSKKTRFPTSIRARGAQHHTQMGGLGALPPGKGAAGENIENTARFAQKTRLRKLPLAFARAVLNTTLKWTALPPSKGAAGENVDNTVKFV